MNEMLRGGRSQFATVKEFAASLDVSPSYIYKLLRDGALPGIRIGSCWRIDMKLIPEYAAKHRSLRDLEKRLALSQEQEPPKKPDQEEILLLRAENERLRAIYEKQSAEIAALKLKRRA